MADYVLDLLNANESVNYSLILSFIAAYIIFLWFIVSVWSFFDAKKRYQSILQPIFFTIFVLLFGPPALIFYIMIRPEHTLDEDYYVNLALSGEKQARPIYFSGDKGFDINLNLSVQPKDISENGQHKMNVEVSWIPKNGGVKSIVTSNKEPVFGGLSRKLKVFGDKISKALKGVFPMTKTSEVGKIEQSYDMKDIEKDNQMIGRNDIKKRKRKKKKKKKKKKR